jgi:hypothetical protein
VILGCDPGKNYAALALFNNRKLIFATYRKLDQIHEQLDHWHVTELHLERQYLTPKHPRPMDIVELAYGAGVVRGAVLQCNRSCKVIEHLPIQWKGNVPKAIMTNRIRTKLDPIELATIEDAGYKTHNTIDAIGIGLFALGRL